MTTIDVLELEGRNTRVEAFRFEVLDASLTVVGYAAVAADFPPTVANDVDRTIRRTLEGVRLPPRPASEADSTLYWREDIDTVAHRLRPIMTIDDVDYPLGVFLFADATRTPHTWGTEADCRLVDQCLILDQPIEQTVGYASGTLVATALADQATLAGITLTRIDGALTTIQAPIAWPAGTRRLKILSELCAMAGFLPPYFANDGYLVCRVAPDPTSTEAAFTYGPGTATAGRVLDGSITDADDLLKAPNRYIAIDTSATTGTIVGVYDIPETAPHSAVNRGYVVATTIELQGLESADAATAAAKARYAQDTSTYRWLAFDAVPDPTHDTFDRVSFDGDLYTERGWRLPCIAGAAHHHDLRRTYF